MAEGWSDAETDTGQTVGPGQLKALQNTDDEIYSSCKHMPE